MAFFNDSIVTWWEGLIMVLMYMLYLVFMIFNEKIFAMCAPKEKVSDVAPEYKIGRRTSEHFHKGLFQGKDREIIKSPDVVGDVEAPKEGEETTAGDSTKEGNVEDELDK